MFQVPEDPFFFCDDCFRQFNYSPKNEKIGNFRAYPFIDVNALWLLTISHFTVFFEIIGFFLL